MLTIPTLTDNQIKDFKRDGFVIVSDSFHEDEVFRIQNWTTELAEMPEVSGKQWVYHENSKLDPGLAELNIYHPSMLVLLNWVLY